MKPFLPQFKRPYASWLTKTLLQVITESGKENKDENGNTGCEEILFQRAFAMALDESAILTNGFLLPYDVPGEIFEIEKNKGSFNTKPTPQSRSDESEYIETMTKMIHFEEAAHSKYLLQFNHKNLKLEHTKDTREFQIKIDNKMSKLAEAVDESCLDHFTLEPFEASSKVDSTKLQFTISGLIKGSNKDFIFVEVDEGFNYLLNNCAKQTYDISFHINRMPFRLQHNALEWMKKHSLFHILINNPTYDISKHDDSKSTPEQSYQFSGKLADGLNEEQTAAVISIVKAENSPLPYLLYGPAGTGKTRTLVSAIEEIVRSSDKCVLVCANANSACDEICDRLLDVLHFGEMFRMYAKSFDPKKISSRIKPICNWVNPGGFRFPSLNFLYQFRVLVCTLNVAGHIMKAREYTTSYYSRSRRRRDLFVSETFHFHPEHFSHVFIDECASAHESMSLIPISGMCTSPGQIHSSVVLAGDPKQLDAVTKSAHAVKLGFETSFMEHLLKRRLYQRNPATDKYDHRFITQLVKNYRSHSSILHMPNALFYDNKLTAKAPNDTTDWFIGSELLPSKNFPVIFKSVQGFCKKSEKDFSLFNIKEVNVVMDYIKQLLGSKTNNGKSITQKDIGVVTPYKLQAKIIARAFRRNNFNDITIGTVEVFQGQEKPIMIVSTVRTDGILGFVKDPRRMNVIITRAKCLLIIVGDPHTLCLDENWRNLVEYCIKNDALIQSDKPFNMAKTSNSPTDEELKKFLRNVWRPARVNCKAE